MSCIEMAAMMNDRDSHANDAINMPSQAMAINQSHHDMLWSTQQSSLSLLNATSSIAASSTSPPLLLPLVAEFAAARQHDSNGNNDSGREGELESLLYDAAQYRGMLSHYCGANRVASFVTDLSPMINASLRLILPAIDAHCSLDIIKRNNTPVMDKQRIRTPTTAMTSSSGDDNNGALDTIPDSLQQCVSYQRAMSMYNAIRVGHHHYRNVIDCRRCVYVAFIRMTIDGIHHSASARNGNGDGSVTQRHQQRSCWVPYTGSASVFRNRWLQVPRRHTRTMDNRSHMSRIRCALWGTDLTFVPHCDLAIATAILQVYNSRNASVSNKSSDGSGENKVESKAADSDDDDAARVFVLVMDCDNDQYRNLEAHVMRELPSLWCNGQSGWNKKREHCQPPCTYCDTNMIGTYALRHRNHSRPTVTAAAVPSSSSSPPPPNVDGSSERKRSGTKRKSESPVPLSPPVSPLAVSSSSLSVATTAATPIPSSSLGEEVAISALTPSFSTASTSCESKNVAGTKPQRSLADDIHDLFD